MDESAWICEREIMTDIFDYMFKWNNDWSA